MGLDTELALMAAGIEIRLNRLRMDIEGWIDDLEIMFGNIDFANLTDSIGTLADTVAVIVNEDPEWETVKTNIQDKLLEIWTDLTGSETFIDGVKNVGKAMMEGMIGGIKEKIQGWIDDGGPSNLITDILANMAVSLVPAAGVATLFNPIGAMIAAGIITGLNDDLTTWYGVGLPSMVQEFLQKFKDKFGIESPSSVMRNEIGEPIAEGIIEGIDNKLEDIKAKAGDIWAKIEEGFSTVWEDAVQIGKDIIAGIMEGIESLSGFSLLIWAAKIAGNIIQAIKDALLMGSPSKLAAMEIGIPLAQGILVGFEEGAAMIRSSIMDATNNLVNYQPTPTSSYTPSAINHNNVTYNMNMGGNVVRSDTDIALIVAANQRAIRNATYGV